MPGKNARRGPNITPAKRKKAVAPPHLDPSIKGEPAIKSENLKFNSLKRQHSEGPSPGSVTPPKKLKLEDGVINLSQILTKSKDMRVIQQGTKEIHCAFSFSDIDRLRVHLIFFAFVCGIWVYDYGTRGENCDLYLGK